MFKKITMFILILPFLISCSTTSFTTANSNISGDLTTVTKQKNLQVFLISYQDAISRAYTICREYFPNDYVYSIDGDRGIKLEHESFFSGDVYLTIHPYLVENLDPNAPENLKYGIIYKMNYGNLPSNPAINPGYIKSDYIKYLRKHTNYYSVPTANFKKFKILMP